MFSFKKKQYFREDPDVHLIQYTVTTSNYYTPLLKIVPEQHSTTTNNNEELFCIEHEPSAGNGNPNQPGAGGQMWQRRKRPRCR
jgi:hypothetical protein